MYSPSCLLCCRSLHSPLIPETGQQGQAHEQAQVFDVFCEYMKLEPEVSVQDEYRGKLFPFCAPCSIQVYRLVVYHQEKVRTLQTLSQMIISMVTLLLESQAQNQNDYLDSGSVAPEDKKLAEQIVTLRKRVINNFSPRVALTTIQNTELSRLTKNMGHNVYNNQERRSLIAPSPDICQEVKIEVFSSDEGNDCGDDSMDVDQDLEAADNEDEADQAVISKDEGPGYARKRSRPRTNSGSDRKSSVDGKRDKRHRHKEIGENLFSVQNCIYRFENNVFKCAEANCLYAHNIRATMNNHIMKVHIRSIPAIPEKSLEDFKIGENKYMLAQKFRFEKDAEENIFRCFRCKYTSVLWSTMYNHIFKMHYRSEVAKPSTKNLVAKRPNGEVKKLGDNEYEYLGIKYFVLPQGSCKCGYCGVLRANAHHIRSHIRDHVDFMPEAPEKSLEACKLATDLYWLSRKFIFEKTGDSFTCSHGECYKVCSTYELMYAHIRKKHWSLEYKSQVRIGLRNKAARRSQSQAGVAEKEVSDQGCHIFTNDDVHSSLDEPPSADPSLNPSDDIRLVVQPVENIDCEIEEIDVDPLELEAPESKNENIPKRKTLKRQNEDSSSVLPQTDTFQLTNLKTSPGFNPAVVLSTTQPAGCSRLTRSMDGVLNAQKGKRFSSPSPDICPEDKAEVSTSEEENDFGDDSMDADYDLEAADENDSSDHSVEEGEKTAVPQKRRRSTANSRAKTKGSTGWRRAKHHLHRHIGENLFSVENCVYKFEDNLFKCAEANCSYTQKERARMNVHIMRVHLRNSLIKSVIPAIPEKSLEDFKTGENKYMLAEKFGFEKDPKENIFRCSSCEYTSVLWSTMYNHIFKMHYRKDVAKPLTKHFVALRPSIKVKKLGENEYEYLGIKYFVLPQGSHKCGFCGVVRADTGHMRRHIRDHVDFMPEVPDKSLEECKLATDLYWLSRKFIFEKTGDSFTCSDGECYEVCSTWERMYEHIRTDHYSLESLKKQRRQAETALRSQWQAGFTEKEANDQECQILTNDDVSSGLDMPANSDPSLTSIPLVAQPLESVDSRVENSDVGTLADLETSPGHYSFNGCAFRCLNGIFHCDFCSYARSGKRSMMYHILSKHGRNSDGFKEVRPNEYLYLEEYPGTKEPDGRFSCGVVGCKIVTTFSMLKDLKAHIIESHWSDNNPPVAAPAENKQLLKNRSVYYQQLLSKCETGPGQYKYRGFEFHAVEDEFECDTCSFLCSRSRESLPIFSHISSKHVDPSQRLRVTKTRGTFVEVRPDEFLYNGRLTAVRMADGRFKCGVKACTSVRSDRSGMTMHMTSTHPENPKVCELCGKIYQQSHTLRIHMNSVHSEAEEQTCPLCQKSFPTAYALKTHLKRSHKKK